jgi:NAD(P)-dependent dehydrogenase (short-subunit alcohol dehydrogenase family)
MRLIKAAGRLSRPTREEMKRARKAARRGKRSEIRAHDAALIKKTLNREARRSSAFLLPRSTALPGVSSTPAEELIEPRRCYICKNAYRRLHHFYESLCPDCAALNFQKRNQSARLDGKVALVTGARIKIGYETALLLLRAGCRVIATTRFHKDAARRYANEHDFAAWRNRLEIHGLDLRHIPSVERFAQSLSETQPRLDFLINNAAQTVRRPDAFYQHLLAGEQAQLEKAAQPLLACANQLVPFAAAPIIQVSPDFPPGQLDLDGQQVDLRPHNSWRMTLGEISTLELLEVHLVNAVAPFVLVRTLRPLLARSGDARHIVNVSAMEAQFARNKKTDKHPHTNMAKAALNMMTRTSAVDFQRNGIFMNSVDTGWITDEDPLRHVARKQEVHDFHPPLDAIDGAQRVLDPIFTGFNSGHHMWGLFLKDYVPVAW